MGENGEKTCEKLCGNCDYGRYIDKDFSAEDYNDYLHIPDEKQAEIADYLFERLEIEKCTGKTIKVFTAGVGPGRIEIPFLNKFLEKGISLNLTAVDLDPGMLKLFYCNIKAKFKVEVSKHLVKNGGKGIHYFSLKIKNSKKNNNIIKIKAFCGNLENLHKKRYYKDKYYDHIFSIFVLHAITNWEEPLYHLLKMLKPGGKIVFAEEIGDVNWLDNHFDDIEKYGNETEKDVREEILTKRYNKDIIDFHRKFWKEYHRARKEGLGKEWTKDTKASDLGVIETCFQRMKDLDLFENSSSNKMFRWAAKEPFTFKLLLNWISGKKQLYTPLNYGLGNPKKKDGDVEAIKGEIDKKEGDNPWKDKYLHKILFDKEDIGDQDALAIYMEWWLNKELEKLVQNKVISRENFDALLKRDIPRIEGHKFHIYIKHDKYNAEKDDRIIHTILYGNTVNLHRLKDRIAYEIHQIPGYYEREMPPNELIHRLFTLRDMYFRLFPFTHTIYTKWEIESAEEPSKGKLQKEVVPVLLTFPKLHRERKDTEELLEGLNRYLASYVLYAYLTLDDDKGEKDFNFTNFIFRNMPEKFPVVIRKEDDKYPYINFSQVSSGNIKALEISFPRELIRSFLGNNKIIKFKDVENRLSIEGSITRIAKESSQIKTFIETRKFYKLNNLGCHDYLLFLAPLLYGLLNEIFDISEDSGKKNRERLKNKILTRIKGLKTRDGKKFIDEAEKRFKDIITYNNWEENIHFDRFLLNVFTASIIGHSTVGEWDIFAKYPGKCFKHDIKGADNKAYIREEGIGGFIIMRQKIDVGNEEENKNLEEIFRKNHEGMLFLISGLWSRNDSILEWGRLTRETMEKHGTKAAVAAIMGRNMSHNIGSHVLANVTTYATPDDDDYKVHLAIFYAYLQGRMDFIARIATEWPLCATPMDFYLDIIKGFKEQYILLENILKSENLNRNGIEFIVTILNQKVCEKIELTAGTTCENSCKDNVNDAYKYRCIIKNNHIINTSDLKNVLVNVPEASIGLQAVYSIMENFIRNSAKHGNKGVISSEGLKLHIELCEDSTNKELYTVRIWDNVSIISDDTKVEMNNKIEGRLIKESGEVEEKDWGVKEMKISAAFLRRKDINEAEENPFNFIKAIKVNCTGTGKVYLGYEFYLEKPKVMMFIIDDIIDSTKQEEAEKYGIYFSNNLKEEVQSGIPHQFLFVNLSNNSEAIINIIKDNIITNDVLPYRIFGLIDSEVCVTVPGNLKKRLYLIQKDEIYKYFNSKNRRTSKYQEAIVKAYETWINSISCANDKYFIVIYFEEDSTNQVVDTWQTIANDINESSSLIHLIILCKNDNCEKIRIISPNKTIMFLRHGGIGLDESLINVINSNGKKEYLYYENIEKGSPIFDVLWNTKDSSNIDIFLLKLIESGLLKILIIDERVAQKTFAEKGQRGNITDKEDNLALMGIMTATHIELQVANCQKSLPLPLSAEVEKAIKKQEGNYCSWQDLRSVTFKKGNFVKVERYKANDQNNKTEIKGFHMIVIHQGVLDKLNSKENNFFITEHWTSVENFISELKQYVPFVIVDSGRGKPINLPKNGKYIEYSIIQDWVLRKPSKFHIVNALMSITGKGKTNE